MIIGRNAAARELGISPQALGKAAKTGRVSQTAEGLYDVEACREQMLRNSNPIKQASARAQQKRTAQKPKHARRTEPVSSPRVEEDENNAAAEASDDFEVEPNDGLRAITIKRELLKLKKERREFRLQGKRLVDGRKVRAEIIERSANERQAVLNIPKRWAPLLATQLGVDERKVHAAVSALVREFLLERSSIPVASPAASPVPDYFPASTAMPPPPSKPPMEGARA